MEVLTYILGKFNIFLLIPLICRIKLLNINWLIFVGLKQLIQQKFDFILVLETKLKLIMLNYGVLNFIQSSVNVLSLFTIFLTDLFHLDIEFQIGRILVNI